jgi:Cu/Zn superoxide dismutase
MLLAVSAALAGCGAWNAVETSAVGKGGGVQAVLEGPGGGGNAVNVRFVDRGDGVFMTVFAANLPVGTYRVLIHANGNCSSPNFFSAGPAWAPAGSARAANALTRTFVTNSNGDFIATEQIPGVHTTGPDGLAGKSVVLHAGSEVTEAVPGVPNERMLCGVVGPLRSFLD